MSPPTPNSLTIDPEVYKRLFIHRTDVFAQQHPGGAYTPVRRPITDDDIAEHLDGLWSIGTYVIDPQPHQSVKYVVFDLDTHDEETTAQLRRAVESLVASVQPQSAYDDPYSCLLNETSGNKGTHVWLFFDRPIGAAKVRRWLARDFVPGWVSVTGGAPLEIFPKQDEVPEGGFGNLVKLPFGVHAVSGRRSEIQVVRGWANSIEEVCPLDVALVPDTPPASETASRRTGRVHRSDGPSSPFHCVDQIIYQGAGQGHRNQAMFHLALYCYGHAVPEDLALEMCERANENFDPPLPDREVRSIVEQAYSGRYVSANCGQDWLRDFCEGPCRTGWKVVSPKETEAGTLRRAEPGTTVEVQVVRKTAEGGRTRLTISHADAANTPTLICE